MTLTLAIGATIIAAVLAAGFYRQRQRSMNLQRQLQAAARDLEHLQNACARLAPAGVVQSLVADGIQPDEGPTAERKSATALFVDLVGFTAMSDRLEPEILLRIINGYYECVSGAVEEHRGHVGSFVGDGIVAYFGAIRPNPWQCDDAVHAALAMRHRHRHRSRPGAGRAAGISCAAGIRLHRPARQSCSPSAGADAHTRRGHPRQRGAVRRARSRLYPVADACGRRQGVRRAGAHLRCRGAFSPYGDGRGPKSACAIKSRFVLVGVNSVQVSSPRLRRHPQALRQDGVLRSVRASEHISHREKRRFYRARASDQSLRRRSAPGDRSAFNRDTQTARLGR
jgi:hypothetical protein